MTNSPHNPAVIALCPGQGAQAVGMGLAWRDASPAAAQTFAEADQAVDLSACGAGAASLSETCFRGPADILNRTDASQPALYTCGIACWRALCETHGQLPLHSCAGLSLGEYTALHLAGAFTFLDGLRLVATRGRLMQQAAEASKGGMVALIGADEAQAQQVCDDAKGSEVLVCANFNAPGQIVLSGSAGACDRAVDVASKMGLRATRLTVAGAFHSPLMAPAAEGMARALEHVDFRPLQCDVWSNVTAKPHHRTDIGTLRKLLVDQITSPVRWSQSMQALAAGLPAGEGRPVALEMAPGSVLKGLMRRIDRSLEVKTHDQPAQPVQPAPTA